MRCFFTFQYISCYSLSEMRKETDGSGKHVSIHLMLLFIFTARITAATYINVSIHLMLLFILTCETSVIKALEFQYISCYSLSALQGRHGYRNRCFNTSHVTLYRVCQYLPKPLRSVSIHLMLLFI